MAISSFRSSEKHLTKRSERIQGLAVLLFALSVLCGPIAAQDFKTVHDGVEYAEVRREFRGKPVNINLLRLDLRKVRLDVHHAMDAAIGTEKTSSIATRHGALAAINAGFFRLDLSIWAGDAAGVLQINRKVFSEPSNDRIALIIFEGAIQQTILFNHIRTKGPIAVVGKSRTINISGINRERKDLNDIVLYTPEFHRTTLTNNSGVEIVVRRGLIEKIEVGKGSSVIPQDGVVLSASGNKVDALRPLRKGQTITTRDNASWAYELRKHGDFVVPDDITNGVPQLIKNGKIDITWEQEKASRSFVETRHPRTAVAKLKDGKFLMLTADGRSDHSAGLDLYDLAAYLLELGAVDAMNLDGGGSTTMYLNGKVVNHPSDANGERKVSDAILVTPRARPRGQRGR